MSVWFKQSRHRIRDLNQSDLGGRRLFLLSLFVLSSSLSFSPFICRSLFPSLSYLFLSSSLSLSLFVYLFHCFCLSVPSLSFVSFFIISLSLLPSLSLSFFLHLPLHLSLSKTKGCCKLKGLPPEHLRPLPPTQQKKTWLNVLPLIRADLNGPSNLLSKNNNRHIHYPR